MSRDGVYWHIAFTMFTDGPNAFAKLSNVCNIVVPVTCDSIVTVNLKKTY